MAQSFTTMVITQTTTISDIGSAALPATLLTNPKMAGAKA
jgi:hypothetical protein